MLTYPLNLHGINQIIDIISDYLHQQDIDRKEITRTRLTLEEILMKYLDAFPETVTCELSLSKRFGQIRVLLKIKSISFDPNSDASEEDQFYNAFMQNLGQAPIWKYRNGENRISFTFSKKHHLSPIAQEIIALVSAVALGIIMRSLLSPEKIISFCKSFFDPLNSAIMGILGGTAVFFVFFSIINGICDMGDIATFNKFGKKMFKRILVILLLSTAALCLVLAIIFPISFDTGGNSFDLSGLWQLIVSIIPVNLVEAFLTGNTLQISFVSLIIGVFILILGEKGENAYALVVDLNNIISAILQWIINFLPITMFISIIEVILQSNLNDFIGIYKYPLFILIFGLVFVLCFVLRTCFTQHIPFRLFFKKIMPLISIALTTSSSTATITESYKICEKKLGIDKNTLHVGWPINTNFLGIGIVIDCIVGCFAVAELFHIQMTIPMIITLGLNACILSMTTPKISGSMVTIYTLVLGVLGIPSSALALLIPLQIITDPITTLVGSIIVHTELIQQAAIINHLDRDILQSDN